MMKYIVKRILGLIPILFIVSIVVFLMVHMTGTDPAVAILGGAKTTPEILANINEKYHFNESLVNQYGYWISDVIKGDFGTSYRLNEDVTTLIGQKLPITIQLILMSVGFGILLSIPIGVLSAVKKNTMVDHILSFLSVICMSAPVFLTGLLLMLIFSNKLGLLPTFGIGSNVMENFKYLLLPSLALGINMVAMNARTIRSSMINVMESNYVQTAIAKGMNRKTVIFKHAMKNAIVPFITINGVQIASLIGGTSIIESTFNVGGMGSLVVTAVLNSDYTIVQGATIVIVAMILCINLLVDVLCAMVDKRIQLR
ncbi:MAG: ABC transporter permease [Lachnospiraceae bacterium]|nr:ABC transporter permease [Lachnospiraceae bacterium]